jgi:TRAP-type C4-dicarboxylate transport system substrate-binding protein
MELTHHSEEEKIMKKKGLVIMAGIICLMFMFTTSPIDKACAAEKVINLKVANLFPPPSKQSKLTEEFAAELQARSGGRLKVQFFGGGSLLSAPAMFKGVETGIADIGYSHVYYTPGRMPVCEGIGLPIGTPTGWTAAHMAYDFYEKFKPKEFGNVRVLCIHGNPPSMIISNKPVEKMEDLKGLTIRAPSLSGEIIAALGGTPAPTPMMEVYDAISKGVINGVWAPYETLKTFRFAEVAKYMTVCWQIGSVYPFYLIMNKNSYNKLPHDLQSLVDTISGQYQERFALMWNEIELVGKAFGTQQGVKYIELSEQEGARWEKAMDPVFANYTKTLVGKGYKEAEVKEWINYMKDRNKYWIQKQMEYYIPSPTGPAGVRPEALCK